MKKPGTNITRLPSSFYNYTSYIGTIILVLGAIAFAFLFLISFIFVEGGAYQGLLMWLVVPSFMVMGLLLIPIGMVFKRRRDKKQPITAEKKWPILNLNEPQTRNAFTIFSIGTLFFLLLTTVGGYKAFHYTESVEFCGLLCHEVMKPEYVAYHHSSHAKVACVECHVGNGAGWYARSKLSGLYQVYAVTVANFPRPIPTPIKNLRPAQETCEECHWPTKFYSRQLVMNKHYLADEKNTEWTIGLQMKTGSAYSALGLEEGIHWHVNPNNKVEYISTDSSRSVIPWIRYTNLETGETKVFEDKSIPLNENEKTTFGIRKMDCIDCHNRPSHDYKTPVRFINNALAAGCISPELPNIKSLAMGILSTNFSTEDSAFRFIESEIKEYYANSYKELYEKKPELIVRAIRSIQEEFSKNIFPEMGVRWNVYPNNIGHLEFDGCFRCHNNKHSTSKGETVSMDCNLCHTIVAQGISDSLQGGSIFKALEFVHPNDEYASWKEGLCSDCHRNLY
jgi:nitrate/TMAO reductase-like tetraheme cytochrome c subunit